MGTLKVDNLQKRDGTALITDGAASTTLLSQASLRSAGVGMVKKLITNLFQVHHLVSELIFHNTLITSDYNNYVIRINECFNTNHNTGFL